ncbi:unnamed protein product [Thlaspi arvense]|uniref:UBX domain-containing protein n=1 Tax=Thlaspi arvense TaxID=13288 RepID=A0AAU9SQ53_THLAR|nr:unnamed protein product [Thlaspi arvense]
MELSEPSGIVEESFYCRYKQQCDQYLDLDKEEPELLTLELKGVRPPTPKSRSLKRLRRRSSADTETITVDGGSSKKGNLYLKISVPQGYHFSKEARSKFNVETEPENQVSIDPVDGYLSPEGTTTLHFRRLTPSASVGELIARLHFLEDEVCLYQSVAFQVPFREVTSDSSLPDITLPYLVKPKTSSGSLQLPVR